MEQEQEDKSYGILERLPTILLTAFLFLLPLFFLVTDISMFQWIKANFVIAGILLVLASFLVLTIKTGQLTLYRGLMFIAPLGLVLVYLVSASFSSSPVNSFFGYGFEPNTAVFISLLIVLMFLVSATFNSTQKLFYVSAILIIVSGILGLFHASRLFFGPDFLSFGVFTNIISNTIGKWNEIGIFFGLSAITSAVAIETLGSKKSVKMILLIIFALSLLIMAFVGFVTLWVVFGIVSAILFIYLFVSNYSSNTIVLGRENIQKEFRLHRKIAYVALVGVMVSVFFATPFLPVGRNLSQKIINSQGVENFEVRPAWVGTYEIFKGVLRSSPILGSGPNRFATQWQLYRPNVNVSDFWNINFNQGVGFVPTSLVETGILGVLAWLFFIGAFLVTGFRALFSARVVGLTRYMLVSTFLGSLLLWIMNVVYTPNVTLLTLTFFLTGLFIASAVLNGSIRTTKISLSDTSRKNLISIIIVVVLLIIIISLGYIYGKRFMAYASFQRGLNTINSEQEFETGENYIIQAINMVPSDIYYRALSELNVLKVENLIAMSAGRSEVTEDEKTQFQNYLNIAIQSALLAERRDPANYENLVSVGRVYATIVPIKIEESYENAVLSYEKAIALSPRNPGLYLILARVSASNGDFIKAEEYINKALELKWNYPEAIFFQSQVDVAKGNVLEAINTVEKLATIYPNEPAIYFRLGLLKYENKDYRGAIETFSKSLTLVPIYANAKYFLGLSYAKVGLRTDAIKQFHELKTGNPDNRELDAIIANIDAGRDAFANATLEESAPEKRTDLPVAEEN